MSKQASNPSGNRRNETMKFAYAGPFVRLLSPIRATTKLVRDRSGKVVEPQPRYAATSAESYSIASRIQGTPAGDVLIPFIGASAAKPRRRRGGRGRKQVAS